MTNYRPPIIANRFEVVFLILLCFIISTRLIWLQIDDRNRTVTDEFYASSLDFNHSLARHCAVGIDPDFPLIARPGDRPLDPDALTSPGLNAMLLGLCQIKHLDLDAVLSLAPHLIGLSAFIVALTARILTSSWVSGALAASVILSRGSILQGTHLAGTFLLIQPLVAVAFLLLALYARTRDARFLPAFFIMCLMAIFASPMFALIAWPLTLALGIRCAKLARDSHFTLHRLPIHVTSIATALILFPAMIFVLHRYAPSSTRGVATFIRQLAEILTGKSDVSLLAGSAIAELERQDLHWQASLAVTAIAATWKRYLPRGSGFWALSLLIAALSALIIDGGILTAAARETNARSIRSIYNMTDAVFLLEPLILGTAASYAWFFVRSVIISTHPSYGSKPRQHAARH